MQLKVNRYKVFYTFYLYFLAILILTTKFNGIPFGAHPVIALSIYPLVVLLPLSFLEIVVLDLINKRFKIFAKNLIIVTSLFVLALILKKYILEPYVYHKQNTSPKIEAAPPAQMKE